MEASWSDNSDSQKINASDLMVVTKKCERYRDYWQILSSWLEINLYGRTICTYLQQRKYGKIVIYGMGMLGKLLVQELYNHKMEISYGIDQNEYIGKKFDFSVYRLEDILPEADIVIVTVEYAFQDVKQQLQKKGNYCIISLKELLDYAEKI